MDNASDRKRPDWQVVKNYKEEATGLTVRVTRDANVKWPRFNIELGKENPSDEDRLYRRISVFIDRKEGDVGFRDELAAVIGHLTKEALEYILETAKAEEAEFQKSKQERSQSRSQGGGNGKPKQTVMRKGKTQRERDKRAQRRKDKGTPE